MPEALPPEEEISPPPISRAAYVLGGASFIPLLGVPLGIAAIGWGFLSGKRGGGRAAALGAGGVAFTVLLYGSLFYSMKNDEGFKELQGTLATTVLTALVKEVEYYRTEHGSYPASLADLPEPVPGSISFAVPQDPTDNGREFYYRVVDGGSRYYLRGLGPDGVVFTADDLLPAVAPSPASQVGLLVAAPENAEAASSTAADSASR